VRDYDTYVYIFVVNKPENTLKCTELRTMNKRAIIIVHLVPNQEAYEGKSNGDIEKEVLEEAPTIPYVAEIERVSVFNSLTGIAEPKSLKEMVMTTFKPVHKALARALGYLAEQGIDAKTIFSAEEGILVVMLEQKHAQELEP